MNRLISLLLSFSLIFSITQLHAGAAEKWEIVEKVYDESTDNVQVTARKVGATASNDPVYKVRVPVSAADLGKATRAGLFGLGMYAAVEVMLKALGWVLDPLTQSIWRNRGSTEVPPNGYDYKLPDRGNQPFAMDFPWVDSPSLVVTQLKNLDGTTPWGGTSVVRISNVTLIKVGEFDYDIRFYEKFDDNSSGSTYTLRLPKQSNPNQSDPVKEFLTDDQLGEEIMGDGENKVALPDVITDVYDPNSPIPDSAPKQKTADALDAANPVPAEAPKSELNPKPNVDTDGDGVPDEYSASQPSLGTEFTWPDACEWFPSSCDFFKVQKQDNKEIKENQKEQIAQDKTFFDKVSEWFDWTKEPPETPEPIDVPEKEIDRQEIKKDLITVNVRSCPADIRFDVQDLPFGIQVNKGVQMQPICDTIEPLKYVFQLMTFVFCGFILLRV